MPHLFIHHADIRDDGDEVEVYARWAGGNIVEKLMKTLLAFESNEVDRALRHSAVFDGGALHISLLVELHQVTVYGG